jgi:hypothetical protein
MRRIFKPELRFDALRRLVSQIAADVAPNQSVTVTAEAGGKSGMSVVVQMTDASGFPMRALSTALHGYNFEFTVFSKD